MLAFIHIEKAAGLTINWIMRRQFGARHCYVEPWTERDTFFSAEDYRRLSRCHGRLASIAGHPIKPYGDLDSACAGIRYYTLLREPLARCAAHYQYQIDVIGRSISFDEWIETDVFRNFQVKKLAGGEDLDAAIDTLRNKVLFTGLVERFDESLVLLKRRLGDERLDVSYERRNTAGRNTIKRRLLDGADTRKRLEAANRLDLRLYDYVVRELYPAQQREYGESLDGDVRRLQAQPPGRRAFNELGYTLHRNLIYKPLLYGYRRLHRND